MQQSGETSTDTDDLIVGFVSLCVVAEHTFMAGLLVTDHRGHPLELRATAEAIRPTPVQRLLFGATLGSHLAELCGRPLVAALRRRPDLILTDFPSFISLHCSELPVVHVRRCGETLELGTATDGSDERVLHDPSAEFRPVTLVFHREAPDDLVMSLRAQLKTLFASFDLVEPFDRVEKALHALHEQASRRG